MNLILLGSENFYFGLGINLNPIFPFESFFRIEVVFSEMLEERKLLKFSNFCIYLAYTLHNPLKIFSSVEDLILISTYKIFRYLIFRESFIRF